MFSRANLLKGIRNPGLIAVPARFWFPWRALRKDRECHHLVRAWTSGRLRHVPLRSVFPGIEAVDVSVRKTESRAVGWSLDLQELVRLLAIVRLTKPRNILEIGTFDGYTTLNLAANLPPGGQVHTVDLPQDLDAAEIRSRGITNAGSTTVIGSKFLNEPEAARITQHWGDSTREDWTKFGAPFDLILIDGCHDDPFVGSDSRNAIKHANPGATIVWHDYGQCVDVSKVVDQLSREHPAVAILGTRFACLRMPG